MNNKIDYKNGNNKYFSEYELLDNPSTRVPICLCLDTSSSMRGLPIKELNDGVSLFYDAILNDEIAMYAADIAVVTFGSQACKERDFSTVQSQSAPSFTANGCTEMAQAVDMALDMLQARKAEYSSKGVDYYQPWLVLMTDGYPTSSDYDIKRVSQRCSDLINNKKLTIFPIGIGDEADLSTLQMFSPKRKPLRLQGLKFSEFFTWLSQSVSQRSQSMPGENVQLDLSGLSTWASLD